MLARLISPEFQLVARPSWQEMVDGAWDTFAGSLPEALRASADDLPVTLRLAPRPLPWSRIFHQEVTLALPYSFAEALPEATDDALERALTAHVLGIVAAFTADRLDDGQVEATPELIGLLEHLRAARDRAIDSFDAPADDPRFSFRAADAATAAANRAEGEHLATGRPSDFAEYRRHAVGKQFLAFPATMCLARSCGLPDRDLDAVASMCLAMALGLQFRDDATDWEDDHREGRSWVERLTPRSRSAADLPALRERVATHGVLVWFLGAAAREFDQAARIAAALGAPRVEAWGRRQAQVTRDLAQAEARQPGHTVRWEIARKQARG
jgi:hypothetical protein